MKNFILIFFVTFLLAAGNANAQLWKQYTDSAKYYAAKQDFDHATDYYDKAKEILARDSLWTMEHLRFCTIYGSFFRSYGYIAEAEPYYIEARVIAEKIGGKNIWYTRTCNNMGLLYMDMGYYSKAEQLFLEAKEINKKLEGKSQSYGLSCNNLGMLYHSKGDYKKAEAYYTEALEVYKIVSGKESQYYLSAINNLATLFKFIGQYEKAEMLFIEAVTTIERLKGKSETQYATFSGNLGGLYIDMKKYKEAEYYLLEEKKAWEVIVGKHHVHYANSLNSLGSLYRDLNQYDKSEQYYLEALKIMEEDMEFGNHYAAICNNLGDLYLRSDRKKAEFYLVKSYQIRKKYGIVDEGYSINCDQLGEFYAGNNQPDSAIKYYLEGYAKEVNMRQSVFAFTSESEKNTFLRTQTDFYDKLLSVRKDFKKGIRAADIYDYSISTRNLLLLSTQQVKEDIHAMGDTNILKKYNDWVETKEELCFWLVKPLADRENRDSILAEKANELEKDLTRLSTAFRKQQIQQETSWKNIQQSLKPGEAAIEFITYQYHNGKRWTDSTYYSALLLRDDNAEPELIELFEKRELDAVFKATKNINEASTANLRYGRNSSLYKTIWQPLEKYLDRVKKIYYAPAGVLHKVSLGAISKNTNERISDKYNLVQLNTTSSVVDTSSEYISTKDKLYLYGGILYDGDTTALKQAAVKYSMKDMASRALPDDLDRGNVWQYLEESKAEIEGIAKMARERNNPVWLTTGLDATEESIKTLNGKNAPSILHIATHGFFYTELKVKVDQSPAAAGGAFMQSDDPMLRTGLTMAGANFAWNGKPVKGIEDGILTAYEVSNLYLPFTKLAVLSACETGLGDIKGGEGVYGLQRAFKIAGVENLLMSLWKVPDAESSEFMQYFYKNLFDKQTISDAFNHAQGVMKNKYHNDPYKWAAWVLVR